ncbi:MAG TPA: M67 family metallopeptidase [Thermoanaerobaculia bacterium]|nr:M67 family metallopeptidase [Thermoanaerobaculia bacterium]
MSRLRVLPRHLEAMERHAVANYPEECCGVILGRPIPDEPGAFLVERILPAANERADSRHNRYIIPPEAVFAAYREAQTSNLDVLGYFHSHPDHPAVPSEFDREHAWPGLSYVIIAVAKGQVAAVRSWRLNDDRESFFEEEIDNLSSPDRLKSRVLVEA